MQFKKLKATSSAFSRRARSCTDLMAEQKDWKNWLENVRTFYKTSKLDSMFVHNKMDNRPYMQVNIHGIHMVALLDSGANQTIIGRQGLFLLQKLNLTIRTIPSSFELTTADGKNQSILGIIDLPMTIDEITKTISTLVSDTISTPLTLGADCCYLFNIQTNFKNDVFTVSSMLSSSKYIHSKDDLTPQQTRDLEVLIEKFKSISGPALGRTSKVIHHIDTGDAKPLKQRYFPMSQPMLKAINEEMKC